MQYVPDYLDLAFRTKLSMLLTSLNGVVLWQLYINAFSYYHQHLISDDGDRTFWKCGSAAIFFKPVNMMALFVFCPREICYIHLVSFLILAACQDSFTRCFKSIPPEPWNWNVYLFPLWCLGVVVRYGFLFPLRLASTWSKVVYLL